jgi:hypothetical protein
MTAVMTIASLRGIWGVKEHDKRGQGGVIAELAIRDSVARVLLS